MDYTHQSADGEPPWPNDPDERFAFGPHFDEFGDYTQRAIQTLSILYDSTSTLTPCSTLMTNQHGFRTYQHDVTHKTRDYEKLRPYFGWVNVDTAQKTMEQSTQWGVSLPNTFPMKKHLKSKNPALNVSRRHEAVATDTVFSDTPAVDSGVKQAQVSVGRDTLEADLYPMKSGKQFVNTLEDNIRRRGAMDKLLSDSAKTEIVENSSSPLILISCSQGILNSSRLSCYLLLRLLVYMYLSQLMRTFTNYQKCIVISS